MGRSTVDKCQVVSKLKKHYEQWLTLKKEGQLKPQRRTFPEKEERLRHELSLLFDIAPKKAKNKKVPDSFESEQGNDVAMAGPDRSEITLAVGENNEESYLDGCDDDDNFEDFSDPDFTLKNPRKRKRSGKKQLINDAMCDALDRAKLSGSKSMFVVNAVLKASGQTPSNFIFSKETIRKKRMLRRETLYLEIQNMFDGVENLVVHWDSKACTNSVGEKDEKLSIAVSFNGKTKMLACPIIQDKRGITQAAAVLDALRCWGIEKNIIGMCFDTTPSNTGVNIGACTYIQKEMDVLQLPCRHHIMELIVGCAFQTCKSLEDNTVNEDILIFKKFKEAWKTLDRSHYDTALLDAQLMNHFTNAELMDVKHFCQEQINTFQPRGDYKEMMQLILTLFGELNVRGATNVDILAPGSVSRARWMSKILYVIKIYLFRAQFDLSADQLSDIRRLICFITKVYSYSWYTCPNAVNAARNDHTLLQKLLEYRRSTDDLIATAAIKKISQHLWYLGEILIGFSFFDLGVPIATKQNMVKSLTKKSAAKNKRRFDLGNNPDLEEIEKLEGTDLSHFVSERTLEFFNILNINCEFLSTHPSQWKHSATYIEQIEMLKKIQVVNDLAERGVALAAEYSSIITKDRKQQQYLTHVIEKHRLEFPNALKKTLTAEPNI